MKPFNLAQALAGAALVTRDGRKVHRFSYTPGDPFPCQGEFVGVPFKAAIWTIAGNSCLGDREDSRDLFMADDAPTAPQDEYEELHALLSKVKIPTTQSGLPKWKDGKQVGCEELLLGLPTRVQLAVERIAELEKALNVAITCLSIPEEEMTDVERGDLKYLEAVLAGKEKS